MMLEQANTNRQGGDMLHTFESGFCTVCGESLDYLVDNRLRDAALIGPMLPVDENQGTLQLTINLHV